MKNINYFPLERNRYFYGKLLSVDDFETEQKYMNNKRRLINRFLLGTGVVCGMNVVVVDDRTLSIETGFALDFAGREIVIDTPVTKKLSMIEGFDAYTEADEENSYLYLCIEYAEQEYEAVHSIAGSMSGAGGAEFNKFKEGYHMFLTNLEPEDISGTTAALYEECKTVYWGNGIRIKQVMPKYARSNESLNIRFIVENMGQQQPISFQYELELSCLTYHGENKLKVSFQEEKYEKAPRYELTYCVNTMAVKEVIGEVKAVSESFELKIGGRVIQVPIQCSSQVNIIEGNIKQEIMEQYYHNGMENIMKDPYQHSIYLAKIAVIKAGSTYIIDRVESMPFSQYAFNHTLAQAMNQLTIHELEQLQEKQGDTFQSTGVTGDRNGSDNGSQIATGCVVFDLGIGGTAGQKYFSEPVAHGLGLGKVHIILGIADGMKEESQTIFGAQDVFEQKEDSVSAELAAKTDSTKGTFVIGLKLNRVTATRNVKVYWTAIKDKSENMFNKQERRMVIRPNMLYLAVRESHYFEANITGTTETGVTWRVKEPDGGSINQNGMYIAPNKEGVYEIIAESTAYSELRASTFVVVRDSKKKRKGR